MATKPSFPHLTDENRPTKPELWRSVLDVASGDRIELTICDRTIHSPNRGRGYRNMPNNPYGIAWAIKQYKGFGGGFVKEATGWPQRLLRLRRGGVEETRDPLDICQASFYEDSGVLRLARKTDDAAYWTLTEDGYARVTSSLLADVGRRIAATPRGDDALALSRWIQANFEGQVDPAVLLKLTSQVQTSSLDEETWTAFVAALS